MNVPDLPRGQSTFDLAADPLEAIESELRLDLEDGSERTFETAVRHAAEASGGSLIFEMPPGFPLGEDGRDKLLRVAAVRFPSRTGERLVFAALEQDGRTIRLLRRTDVGERFYGFARAYLGILNRLQAEGVAAGST